MEKRNDENLEKIPPKLWECLLRSAEELGVSVTKLAHACFRYALEQDKKTGA